MGYLWLSDQVRLSPNIETTTHFPNTKSAITVIRPLNVTFPSESSTGTSPLKLPADWSESSRIPLGRDTNKLCLKTSGCLKPIFVIRFNPPRESLENESLDARMTWSKPIMVLDVLFQSQSPFCPLHLFGIFFFFFLEYSWREKSRVEWQFVCRVLNDLNRNGQEGWFIFICVLLLTFLLLLGGELSCLLCDCDRSKDFLEGLKKVNEYKDFKIYL